MNCHMPRINEGMQDVVRTHMIFSPTNRAMIEANHPNACNLCHTRESISWTQRHLSEWYKAEYDSGLISKNDADAKESAALGWLASANESVRLVAGDALTRADSKWALPQLIEALDDPFLLNRQFGEKNLESLAGVRLNDYGYRFYMTPEERKGPIQRIRRALLPRETPQKSE